MKNRYVITGLPRSGTTIVARFAESLAGVAMLHEPIQASRLFADNPEYWLHLFSQCMDDAKPTLMIKEVFHPLDSGCRVSNVQILNRMRATGWKFIYVDRNPAENFLAQKAWGEDCYLDPGRFALTHAAFKSFSGRAISIQYESFCEDPVAEWNRVVGLRAPTEVTLKPCLAPGFMGCFRAKDSLKISRRFPESVLTETEERVIKDLW